MWIELTAEGVKTRLSAPELTALGTAAKQAEQTAEGLLASAIEKITVRVRGYVAACNRNVLGPTGTIPEELEAAALALIREHLFTRLPGMRSLYDALRQEETKSALQELRDTAACRFAIVNPEEPAEEQAANPTPRIEPKTHHFDRCSQEGI